MWRQLAELGLPALALPEAHGGFGGGMADLMPAFQAFGGALLLEPALPAIVLAPTALRHAAPPALQAELLPALAAGRLRLGWAHDEPAARHLPLWVEARARRDGDRWTLDGAKGPVLHGGALDGYVASARVDGAPDAADGLGLFLVDADAPGLAIERYRLQDDTPAAALAFSSTPARPIVDGAAAHAALQRTLAAGIAAACADMVGAMEAVFRLTLDRVQLRKQFGRAIGDNQAVRHRVAEMAVGLEAARSMAIAAALAADDPHGDGAELDSARAKLVVGRQARALCHAAIQLHGGIGMTEECAVGHCLRRVVVLDQCFGDADAHAARLAAQL